MESTELIKYYIMSLADSIEPLSGDDDLHIGQLLLLNKILGKFGWYNEYADLESYEIQDKLKELEEKYNENKWKNFKRS